MLPKLDFVHFLSGQNSKFRPILLTIMVFKHQARHADVEKASALSTSWTEETTRL